MARFNFPLQSVLNARERQERLAAVVEVKARVALQFAEARLLELKKQGERLGAALRNWVGVPTTPGQWTMNYEVAERTREMIDHAEQEVQRFRQAHDEARKKRAKLAAEAEALNTLRQEQKKAFELEQDKIEQAKLNEFAIQRVVNQGE